VSPCFRPFPRAMAPRLASLFAISLLWGCVEPQTAVVVEFELAGAGIERAVDLEIVIACEDESGRVEHPQPFDLTRHGESAPSLVLEPGGGELCTILLGAQVLDSDGRPIASSGQRLSFAEDDVQRVTVTLDTSTCNDLDNDGFFAGLGGEHGCGQIVDCDDLDEAINPDASEVCNDLDDNCDGEVDNLDLRTLAEECEALGVHWNPGVGLCRFTSPQCLGGEIFCPELFDRDECDPPLDTNCDGRLAGCGCDPALLDTYRCPDCHRAVCRGAELFCEPPENAELLGLPCEQGSCAGIWQCDPESGEVRCAMGGRVEICNNGVDDTCDGFIDGDYWPCLIPTDGLQCPPVTLFSLTDIDLPSFPCDPTSTYNLEQCNSATLSPGDPDLKNVFVLFAVPWSITVTRIALEGCCGCSAWLETEANGSGGNDDFGENILALVIEGYLGQLLLDGPPSLTAFVDIDITDDNGVVIARYLSLPITIPIEATSLRQSVECLSLCFMAEEITPRDG
jgi:hypothetical protein